MSGFPENAFTVASADNLDFIHSHARIYCGKQQSSWHGTTVQIVQPQPSTLVDTSQELLVSTNNEPATHAEPTTSSNTHSLVRQTHHPDTQAMGTLEIQFQAQITKRSHSTISPFPSPSKRSPIPKQQRRMRTGTEKAVHKSNRVSEADTKNQRLPTYRHRKKTLTELEQMSTQYILLKVAASEHNETMTHLQNYFSLSKNIPKPECSNIIYFKVP